jgi:hypothetical protein
MNKRIIGLLVALSLSTTLWAQDESDALRYSFLTDGGTARAQAVGGAMGSVGGDISSMTVNPAGIGFFKTNDFSITPALNNVNNSASYYDNMETNSKSDLYLQEIGAVFASDKRSAGSGKWENISFAIGENRLANFNSNLYYQGTINNPKDYSSYSDNYLITLANANETSVQNAETNYPFGVSESVNAGLIGPIENTNGTVTGWNSLPSQIIADGYPLLQSNLINTKGGLNEVSLAIAGNYSDKFYIGAALNIPSIKYTRDETFTETNTQDNSSPLNNYNVYNYLNTTGVGINGKFGIIYKPVPSFRLGLAYHTPTYYSMHDTYFTTVTTDTKDEGILSSTTADVTGGYDGDYTYNLTTPMRFVASATYIFGEGAKNRNDKLKGFLTADCEMVNYGNARYKFDQSNESDVQQQNAINSSIGNLYTNASNIRVGGELKFNVWSVRAGIADYGDPYKNNSVNANRMLYSGGVGLRQGGVYLALTYVYSVQNDFNQPYYVMANSLNVPSPEVATFTQTQSNFIFTFGFKF